MTQRIVNSVFLSFLLAAAGICAAHDEDKASTGLGTVKFQNSCSPAVQKQLQEAVAMLHSFFYTAAVKAFEDVGRQDERCAIAGWGYASILMNNPLAGTGASPKDAPLAQVAIDKARAMNAKTQRERDYVEAVAAYYDNFASRSERERQVARAEAYAKLAATPCTSRARSCSRTRPTPITSRPRRSSRSSSRSTPSIPAWRTT